MKILILTDGKAGHENQSRAFARALGGESEIVSVRFKTKLHKLLSYVFDRIGIRTSALFTTPSTPQTIKPTNPQTNKPTNHQTNKPTNHQTNKPTNFDIVIGTGSGTFYAAKTIAAQIGAKCGVVLYPRGYDIASFDCILAPAFDRPPAAPNVLDIPANLVASDAAFYEQGVADFKEHYRKTTASVQQQDNDATSSAEAPNTAANGSATPSAEAPSSIDGQTEFGQCRIVAVIIGGPNKCSSLTPAWMREQLERIFADNQPTSSDPRPVKFWTTTSRRTPSNVEAVVDSFPWDYKLIYSRDHFNPIPAFVSLANVLYVTAESTGMISEACTFGTAEVHALDNLNPGPHKFRRFVEDLIDGHYLDGCRKIDLSIQFAAARALLTP